MKVSFKRLFLEDLYWHTSLVMSMKNLQVRIEQKLYENAVKALEDIGMDLPTAVRMFLRRIEKSGGFPFDISPATSLSPDTGKSSASSKAKKSSAGSFRARPISD